MLVWKVDFSISSGDPASSMSGHAVHRYISQDIMCHKCSFQHLYSEMHHPYVFGVLEEGAPDDTWNY
jgi:hypothetical protein